MNTFLPMRNKFILSIKIYALKFSEFLESIFCLLLVMEAFSLQKNILKILKVVSGWREIR